MSFERGFYIRASKMKKPLLTAVGDISFVGRNVEKPSMTIFNNVSHIFKDSEIVCANLENPLIANGSPVEGKCVLRGVPEWAEILKNTGINLVSLANNHMMDFGSEGLRSTINALQKSGILFVGAGENKSSACAPVYMETSHGRVAILARTEVEVSSPSYATESIPGVALLQEEETLSSIRLCKENSELIILMIHWGIEEYDYPSPAQKSLAQKLLKSGADIIVGHHPHVLQGLETYGNKLVAYSLGNFIFDDFEWLAKFNNKEMNLSTTLSAKNRESMILQVVVEQNKLFNYRTIFTKISKDAEQHLEQISLREKRFAKLSSRLGSRSYSFFWKIYALRQEWILRLMPKQGFRYLLKNIHKLRLRHAVELIIKVKKSFRVASEKTTNPYE